MDRTALPGSSLGGSVLGAEEAVGAGGGGLSVVAGGTTGGGVAGASRARLTMVVFPSGASMVCAVDFPCFFASTACLPGGTSMASASGEVPTLVPLR